MRVPSPGGLSVQLDTRVRSGSGFEKLASYSRAARIGNVVAVSGTAALDQDGSALHPGDAYLQTLTALQTALHAAAQLGVERDRVVRTRIYLAPGCDWRGATRAHGELFKDVDPANTTLFVAGFIPPGALVEVEIDGVCE